MKEINLLGFKETPFVRTGQMWLKTSSLPENRPEFLTVVDTSNTAFS